MSAEAAVGCAARFRSWDAVGILRGWQTYLPPSSGKSNGFYCAVCCGICIGQISNPPSHSCTLFWGPSWLSNEKSENQFRVGLYGVVGYRKNCQLDQTNSRCCITMKVPLAGGFEHVESMWSEQDYTKYNPPQQKQHQDCCHENHHSSCKGSVVE